MPRCDGHGETSMPVERMTLGGYRLTLCRWCEMKARDDLEFANAVKTIPNYGVKMRGELPHVRERKKAAG